MARLMTVALVLVAASLCIQGLAEGKSRKKKKKTKAGTPPWLQEVTNWSEFENLDVKSLRLYEELHRNDTLRLNMSEQDLFKACQKGLFSKLRPKKKAWKGLLDFFRRVSAFRVLLENGFDCHHKHGISSYSDVRNALDNLASNLPRTCANEKVKPLPDNASKKQKKRWNKKLEKARKACSKLSKKYKCEVPENRCKGHDTVKDEQMRIITSQLRCLLHRASPEQVSCPIRSSRRARKGGRQGKGRKGKKGRKNRKGKDRKSGRKGAQGKATAQV